MSEDEIELTPKEQEWADYILRPGNFTPRALWSKKLTEYGEVLAQIPRESIINIAQHLYPGNDYNARQSRGGIIADWQDANEPEKSKRETVGRTT